MFEPRHRNIHLWLHRNAARPLCLVKLLAERDGAVRSIRTILAWDHCDAVVDGANGKAQRAASAVLVDDFGGMLDGIKCDTLIPSVVARSVARTAVNAHRRVNLGNDSLSLG